MAVNVIHAVPGRVRLRASHLKANPERARDVQSRLAGLAEVRRAEVNPLTGSVLVSYHTPAQEAVFGRLQTLFPELDAEQLHNGRVGSADGQAGSPALAREIAGMFQQLNARVEQGTGWIDLKMLVPLLLVYLGVSLLVLAAIRRQGVPLPGWYELLWFAFNTFIILNLPLQGDEPAEQDRR